MYAKIADRFVAIPAALLLAGGANAQVASTPLTGTRLDISAEAAVTRAPDLVTISAGVITQAPTAAAAMNDNANRMSATVAALRKAGVADRDIRTAAISLSPQYRYNDGKPPVITGYQASNQLEIRFRDVKRAGPILDALVAEGANQINGPDFGIEDADAALDAARTAAMAKARARAELYAKASGLRVKRILAISEAGAAPPPPMPMVMAMERKAGADTMIVPGEQKVSVTVAVSFELE